MLAALALSALKVLLLAGGVDAEQNHHSHYVHVTRLLALLGARGVPPEDVGLFWADGEDPGPDRVVDVSRVSPGDWLIEGTRVDRDTVNLPEPVDTRFPDRRVRPATRAALQAWLEDQGARMGPDDTLLIAVTDHGEPDPEGGVDTRINLWGETWSTEQLLEDLRPVPTSSRVVLWMSQCHSGGFSSLHARRDNLCGAFSASPERVAYGCYPELAGRTDVGHFLRFLEALARGGDIAGANDEVLLTDDTPDTPHLTSDAFLWEALERRAEQREADLAGLIDARLEQASADDPTWRLVARLAVRFGLGVIDSQRAVDALLDELSGAAYALDAWSQHWQIALDQARKLLAEPVLRKMREPRGPEGRSAARRKAMAAIEAGSRKREGLRARLEALRTRVDGGARIADQLELQEAAAIRAAWLLGRLAGPAVLGPKERARLETLRACETAPVLPPALDTEGGARLPADAAPRPPAARLHAAVESLRPGYLGLSYRDGPDGIAVFTGVVAGSPGAATGGLRSGDQIVAVDGWALEESGDLRTSVLLANPGSRVSLTVRRKKATFELPLVAAPMPLPPAPPVEGDSVPRLRVAALQPGTSLPPLGEGRPVLLFFWSTTCKPCREALPGLERWAAAHGAEVMGITREETADVRRYLARSSFPFAVALDPEREATRLFEVDQMPLFVVVDPRGRVQHRAAGFTGKLLLD